MLSHAFDDGPQVQPSNERDTAQISELISASQSIADDEDRFRFLAKPFVEMAPSYCREMTLPPLAPGVIRLDLSSFDCSSFVYFLTAMQCAQNVDAFLWALKTIRYRDSSVSANNLIHFTDNGMRRIIEADTAADLTDDLASPAAMRTRTVRLGVKGDGWPFFEQHRRPEFWEGKGHLISGDSNLGETVSLRYIHYSAVLQVEPLLKCGDILFLASSQDPHHFPELITHAGFAYRFDDCPDKTFLLHCSSIEWSVVKGRRGGVCIARFPDWTRQTTRTIGRYCQLHEYFDAYAKHFDGLIVLRPRTRSI